MEYRKNREYAKVTQLEGMPRFLEALPLAIQHVVAMIVGCVTPAIILAGVGGGDCNGIGHHPEPDFAKGREGGCGADSRSYDCKNGGGHSRGRPVRTVETHSRTSVVGICHIS